MKHILPLFAVLFIIASFSFLTGSSYIYSTASAFNPQADEAISKHNGKTPAPESGKSRDIKIPGDNGANEQKYSFRENYGNAEIDSTASSAGKQSSEDSGLVVIDAGHGGNDPGTSGNGVIEKDISLDIAKRLDSLLKHSSIRTYMIRTDDRYIDHKDRIELANSKNAALYISIHCDSYKDSSYNGTTTLYYPSKELSAGGLNEIDYAYTIHRELMKVLETKDRGINDRADLAVLRRAKMPSVLIELGFLSNKNDAGLLSSEDFRKRSAEAMAEGIKKALAKISAN